MSNQGIITREYTTQVQKVIREIVNDPTTYRGAKYLPSVAMPVSKIYVDVVEASGGLTQPHILGAAPKYIQGVGNRTLEFSPGFWKEAINYNEQKILFLRQLGKNTDDRGIRSYIDLDIDKLNRRLEARIELLRWQAIFNGSFTYFDRTVSFGIPVANRATPIGANWSSDGISVNNSANPIADLRYWLQGGLAAYRKYKVRKILMNPNTARWILENSNVKSYATSYAANPLIKSLDLNNILSFLLPGCPECDVYDGWYQEETTVDGKVTVGDAVFFVPDGYLFFEVGNLPDGDKIGEFTQTLHLASGSIDQPGNGKYIVIDDQTAAGTAGGPKNPFVDLVAGVHGGPKLERSFDVLTAKVIA